MNSRYETASFFLFKFIEQLPFWPKIDCNIQKISCFQYGRKLTERYKKNKLLSLWMKTDCNLHKISCFHYGRKLTERL